MMELIGVTGLFKESAGCEESLGKFIWEKDCSEQGDDVYSVCNKVMNNLIYFSG